MIDFTVYDVIYIYIYIYIKNGFKWVTDPSRFNDIFRKNYNKNSDVGYFLEVDVEHPKKLFGSHKDLPFLPERKKLEKVEKLEKTTFT